MGFEPMAPCLQGRCSNRTELQRQVCGGGNGTRTRGLLNAIQALYRLSYTPD